MRNILLILLALSPLVFVSCASIVSGGPDAVSCDSEPRGAVVYLDGQPVGKTPCQVMVPKSWGSGELTFFLDDGREITAWPYRTINPWVFGNIVFGGVIGILIDCGTGNCRMSKDYTVKVDFESMAQVDTTPKYIDEEAIWERHEQAVKTEHPGWPYKRQARETRRRFDATMKNLNLPKEKQSKGEGFP